MRQKKSVIDVCRKLARERQARTVLRVAPKQVIRAIGLSKQYTDTYRHQHDATATSPSIPFAVRYSGFVLSRFTVRHDGRTPFQYLLGSPYVSPLCMFGEWVFALIPDHEVAKLTNRCISCCWWGRDASSDEHLVGTKFGVLKCRSVRRKPPGEQWSRRETVEARGTKLNFDVGVHTGIPGPPLESRRDEEMPSATVHREIPTVPPLGPPPEPDSRVSEPRGPGVHAIALRIRAF